MNAAPASTAPTASVPAGYVGATVIQVSDSSKTCSCARNAGKCFAGSVPCKHSNPRDRNCFFSFACLIPALITGVIIGVMVENGYATLEGVIAAIGFGLLTLLCLACCCVDIFRD